MKRSQISLCLLSLLNGLSLYFSLAQNLTDLDQNTTNKCIEIENSFNQTSGGCLIDTQMGLIAVASAGGLVICLLVSTLVLACQICYLQRRIRPLHTSRSNVDLVSGTGYWGTDQPEVQGLVGPCDASVMLEEMRAANETEENASEDNMTEAPTQEVPAKANLELDKGAKAFEEMAGQMHRLSSRDSCLEVPRDLEDMPLVV